MTNDVYLYLKKMKLPTALSTWKLRKRAMEKQKRQSANMLQFLMHGIYPEDASK